MIMTILNEKEKLDVFGSEGGEVRICYINDEIYLF